MPARFLNFEITLFPAEKSVAMSLAPKSIVAVQLDTFRLQRHLLPC